MLAIIDIKTPAGKSLEGFPKALTKEMADMFHLNQSTMLNISTLKNDNVIQLHPGDKITIEIV